MTVRPDPTPPGPRPRPLAWVVVAALAGGIAGLAAVYGIAAFQRNAGADAACRPAVEAARRVAPLVRGEVAAISVANAPRRVPELAFRDAAGQPRMLADWRGRVV